MGQREIGFKDSRVQGAEGKGKSARLKGEEEISKFKIQMTKDKKFQALYLVF